MTFLLLALGAHALNALVFVIDKGILGQRTSRMAQPLWYAAYSGLVSAGAAVLLAYDFAYPTAASVGWALVAGLLWLIALWLFFRALQAGEASRIVPIAGSSVPVWTFILAALLLGERLGGNHLMAVVLLMVGGMVLSRDWRVKGAVSPQALVAAVASGAAFAAHFAVVKIMYAEPLPFLASFAYVRLGVGVWAGLLLVCLWYRQGLRGRVGRREAGGGRLGLAFVSSKGLGMVALLMQNYAIALGSVTVVNALQGTQYLFVWLLSLAVSLWAPRIFREEVGRFLAVQKLGGITLVGAGLYLLVI